MCLLTFMHEGVTPNIDHLINGADNNPDGFGYAINDRTSIIRGNGLNFERVLENFLQDRQRYNGPALFHSRITTHGGTTRDNCHPFQVGRDTGTVLAHNGMLPIKERDGKSDTRIFAESVFPSWGGVRTLSSKKMRKKLSKFATGSKLVFLTTDLVVPEGYAIINEKDGHWDHGVWWSNSSYKYKRISYGSGSFYSSGWSSYPTPDWDSDDSDDGVASVYYDEDGTPYFFPKGRTTDLSYTDMDGNHVWQEVWECATCRNEEFVDEEALAWIDFCGKCDSCFFCGDHRHECTCLHQTDSINPPKSDHPTLWGYDKSLEMGTL